MEAAIKAYSVSKSIEYRRKIGGEKALQAVFASLTPADVKALTDYKKGSDWISLDVYSRYQRAVLKAAFGGNESKFLDSIMRYCDDDLRGIHRTLIRLGSPAFISKRAPTVLKVYFRGVKVKVESPGPKQRLTIFSGFKREHRVMELIIVAWIKVALTISGAKNLKVEITKSLAEGEGCFHILDTWD